MVFQATTEQLLDYPDKTRIFLDMDGTLAEFRTLSTLEDLLEPGYFLNLEPIQAMIEATHLLVTDDNYEVYILTSCLKESKTAIKEKSEWLNRYLPEIDKEHRIFARCGESKTAFLQNSIGIYANDVLIDDYHFNLNQWHGLPIKFFNGINGDKNEGWNQKGVYHTSSGQDIVNAIRFYATQEKQKEFTQER